MKLFISHSSANRLYGEALVEFFRGIGFSDDQIIFTSNTAYGIPTGKNIFHWLKSQIIEKPFVIYLLSNAYYGSVACLNEMGAAWVVENEHAVLFVPGFDLNSTEFLSGALDPREMGFYLGDEERMWLFVEQLRQHFSITQKYVIIHQKISQFKRQIDLLDRNNSVNQLPAQPVKEVKGVEKHDADSYLTHNKPIEGMSTSSKVSNSFDKLSTDAASSKLKDDELLLLHYMATSGKLKLMTGWQESSEIENIRAWEEVHGLNNLLSKNYKAALNRFALRNYLDVSAMTSYGNAKELILKSEIAERILDLPDNIEKAINAAVDRNLFDDLPF